MKQVMIASNNPGKVREFKAMLSTFGVEVTSLENLPEPIDVAETGHTFRENAKLKAEEICRRTNMITIADDSGLVVDALNGRPGIYSARYAGPQKNDHDNLQKVLNELAGITKQQRTARFVCVLAVSIPTQETRYVEGEYDGLILEKPVGENGFGYDPIFFITDAEKTLAQMSQEEKNKISHRANAIRKLEKLWPDWVGDF